MRREPSPDISVDAVESDRPTTPVYRPSCIEKASYEVRESVQGDIMIHLQISAQGAFSSAEAISPVELTVQDRSVVGTIPSTTQELTASQIGRKFPQSLTGQVNFNHLGKDERRVAWAAYRLQVWLAYNQANAGSFTNIKNWLLKKPVHEEEFLKEKVDQFLAKTHKAVCVVQIGQHYRFIMQPRNEEVLADEATDGLKFSLSLLFCSIICFVVLLFCLSFLFIVLFLKLTYFYLFIFCFLSFFAYLSLHF